MPPDFETWPKSKQIRKVSQLRTKIMRPEQHTKTTKRSSVRSRMVKKQDMIVKWKQDIARYRAEATQAQVGETYSAVFHVMNYDMSVSFMV